MKYLKLLFPLILLATTACSTDSNEDSNESGSVIVINEGAFQAGNASLTLYNPITGNVQHNIFSQHNNGRPLGDVAQSATLIDDRLFVVVNNSHKIEVINPATLISSKTISFENDFSPRYIQAVGNDKAYVTSFSESVAIINLNSLDVIDYIHVGAKTEGIGVVGNKAFVANIYKSDFSASNVITVIDIESNEIVDTLELRSEPSIIQVDNQNRVWVVCGGDWGANNAAIYVLNGHDGSIIEAIELNAGGGDLVLYESVNIAYISSSGIRVIDMDQLIIEDTPITSRSFYSLGFNEANGPHLYAGDARNFQQAGVVLIYDINGALVDSFSTGIAPTDFYFIE